MKHSLFSFSQSFKNSHRSRYTASLRPVSRRTQILRTTNRIAANRALPRQRTSSTSHDGGSTDSHSNSNPSPQPIWTRRPSFWTLAFLVYVVSEFGQGYYIGYWKERSWQMQNNYSWMPWSDTTEAAGKDSKLVEKDGYVPLVRPLEIRVLILHPGNKASPLECTLEHRRLGSSKAKFDALSYVWGDPAVTAEITCNNKQRSVGRNLYDALERLRLPGEERVLWIDALCINQADNREKTQQVRLMGQIYSKAQRVLIWLGNNEAIQAGVGKLASRPPDEKHVDWKPLKPVFTNIFFYQAQAFLIWLGFDSAVNMGVANLEEPQSPRQFDWSALVPVVQSPWFNRVWCIQELVLASNPIIVTRDSMISWNQFARAVVELRTQFDIYRMKTQHRDNQSIENFYFLHDMRQKHRKRRRQRHNLLELLFLTRGFQATDPRDKLFALVGLAGDVLSSDWEVTPNYDLSVAEVYHRFALWHLTRKRQFEIFSFGRGQGLALSPELDTLPSWVPDLTRPDFAAPLPKLENLSVNYIDLRYDVLKEFERRKKYFGEATKVYHADLKYPWWALGRQSDFRPARIAFSQGTAVIHVVGTQIGALKTLGTPFDKKIVNTEFMDEDLGFASNIWHTWAWLNQAWAVAGQSVLGDKYARLPRDKIDAVWRTVICCMTANGKNAQFTIYSRAAQALHENFLENAQRLGPRHSDRSLTQGDQVNKNAHVAADGVVPFTEDLLKKLLLMHTSAVKWCPGRRFAVTDAGDFAAVPTAAQKGDVVCIFNGGRVPYVLRPGANGNYTLVGECYVDGMMRGEVRDRFPRRSHETSFSIQ
ncbi:heterokaryon incompatibility domain-containing protein [Trichoderma pleuroticola]